MRLFIALPLGKEAMEAAAAWQAALRRAGVGGSFTRPENLHLTLAFLGEQPSPEKAGEALTALEAPAGELVLDRCEVFRRSDILYLAPGDDAPARTVALALERELRSRGFRLEERSFKAHLTLCRRLRLPETGIPQPEPIRVPVKEAVLFESHRPAGVLTYTPLVRKALTAAPWTGADLCSFSGGK